MADATWESTKTTKNMGMESISGLMADSISVNGFEASNTVLEFIKLLKPTSNMVSGKKERELNGSTKTQ